MESYHHKIVSMRNKKHYLLVGIITFVGLFLSIYVYVMMPRGEPLQLSPIQYKNLSAIVEDGDIILRLGDRIWSQFFRDVSVTDRRFSHMGIIRVVNDEITVVHAEGDIGGGIDFVNEIPLKEFIEVARTIGIYRSNTIDGNLISSLALEYLGVPFDWQFDMTDDSKIYCTELLYIILKRLAPEIKLDTIFVNILQREIIPLEAISNSEYFYEILFIGTSE